MSSIELRYLASRSWMASEIHAGRAIQHRAQALKVDPGSLNQDLARRVEELDDCLLFLKVRKKLRVCVLDSGIDPELSFGPTEQQLKPIDQPIVDSIGPLPELPAPSDDPLIVVEAWEAWLRDYKVAALQVIADLSEDPPAVGMDESLFSEPTAWDSVGISLGDGLARNIGLDQDAQALRDARAGRLWAWAASRKFSSESIAAAQEATALPSQEAQECLESMDATELAELFLRQSKARYEAAKAHHLARQAAVPDFETEMARWAKKRGSERLRLGIEDGYRMNSRYLAERIAAEAPGMYAMSASAAADGWASKAASPSGDALRLRRRIAAAMARNAPPNFDGQPDAEIVIVRKPPHEIYFADGGIETENGTVGQGLPSRDGWPWDVGFDGEPIGRGPKAFEAVIVKHWLGKFHLIGAVGDEWGNGPPGIWAVPDIDLFAEDGTVIAQDPDEQSRRAARRKPPEPDKDDDIPF
jgi:hypothetical protein